MFGIGLPGEACENVRMFVANAAMFGGAEGSATVHLDQNSPDFLERFDEIVKQYLPTDA